MKAKKISWQAIAIVVLALVLIASIALGVSGAWFQDKDSGKSEATLGDAITLRLQNVDGTSVKDGVKGWANIYDSSRTNAYPGDIIIGKTQIKMASTSPALIRVSLVAKVQSPTGAEGDYEDVDLTATLEEFTGVTTPTSLANDQLDNVKAYYNALIALKPIASEYDGSSDDLTAEKYDEKLNAYTEKAEKWNKWLLKNMTAGLNLNKSETDTTWVAGKDEGNNDVWYYNKVYGNVNSLSGKNTGADDGVIALFDKAELSSYLTNEVERWKVSIDLKVEAIQAAHADETTHPWNAKISTIESLYGKATLGEGESNANTTVLGYNAGREKTEA